MKDQLPDLIQRCRKDERKAQFELYRWWFNDLMRMAYRYKNNEEDAAALVNLAFFKILTKLDKYDDKVPFEGWVKRIMLNTVIDEFRKDKKNDRLDFSIDDEERFFTDTSDDQPADRKFETEDLEQMMNQLNEYERLVFNLFEMDGYSHREIAAKLRVSERSSKRYLARAKDNLKQMIVDFRSGEISSSSVIMSVGCWYGVIQLIFGFN